ncbi:hypothetical protein EH183_01825 [Streptomyces sp. CB01881]|nr:hypothetical protein C2142_01820 [Streptomyces sp. CB01881]TYC76388.1 hypothetical protein EH183_01825 [Streptomyces sp. CB01881]
MAEHGIGGGAAVLGGHPASARVASSLAEALALALDGGSPPGDHPETAVARPQPGPAPARLLASGLVGAVTALAAGAVRAVRHRHQIRKASTR